MALVIDASTPAFATAAGPVSSITSPQFSPPAGSVIFAFVGSAENANHSWGTITDSLGSHLTWSTPPVLQSPAGDASVSFAWAVCPSAQTNMTVTFTSTSAQNMSSIGLGVIVFTGAATTQNGATATATNNSGTPTGSVTTTATGSIAVAIAADFHATPAPTASGGQTFTFNGNSFAFTNGAVGASWCQWTGANTAGSGTVVTLSDTAPTASEYAMYLVEVLADSGGQSATPNPIVVPSPAVMMPSNWW